MPAPRTAPAAPARDPATLIASLACALAAAIVFHRALAYGFSQDDFLGLARASGLAPRLTGAWRWLSHQAFFDVMRVLAGLSSAQYHAVALIAHLATVVLLWTFLARRTRAPAATVGAAFFAVHPALFTALYWISAVGDVLALLFALAAWLLAERRDAWRWLAVPAFACSLLSKESTLLLPLAMLIGAPRGRRRDPVVLTLIAVAALDLVALVAGNAFGVREGVPAAAPYAIGWGAHLWQNALTYLGWAANFLLPTVSGFSDAVDPDVYVWGVALAVVLGAGCFLRPLRERGWLTAVALCVALLVPLLPLAHHTNHYYLYAPLAAIAWCLAAAADALIARTGTRAAWTGAALIAALLTLNGALLVAKIEHAPFAVPGLRADPTVDRALIATHVIDGLRAEPLPDHVALRFWSPVASSIGPRGEPLGGPAPQATYWENNVRQALLDGLAVRVILPQVASVTFVREFTPAPENERYVVYKPDGTLVVHRSSEVDSILRAMARADSTAPRD